MVIWCIRKEFKWFLIICIIIHVMRYYNNLFMVWIFGTIFICARTRDNIFRMANWKYVKKNYIARFYVSSCQIGYSCYISIWNALISITINFLIETPWFRLSNHLKIEKVEFLKWHNSTSEHRRRAKPKVNSPQIVYRIL